MIKGSLEEENQTRLELEKRCFKINEGSEKIY